MTKWAAMLIAFSFLLSVAWARGERPALENSFAMRTAPRIAPAHHNGTWELVYELHLVNCSKTDLTVERIELFEVPSGKLRTALDGAALTSAIGRMDRQAAIGVERRIPSGVEAIVYMSVEWSDQLSRRVTLKHRLAYSADFGNPSNPIVEGGEFQVLDERPVVLGAPLRGGDWTPIYADMWKSGHRRVIYATNGVEHIPGRFAIDWMKVAPDGSHATGDETNPANWYGYGADVLAVADATVSVAMDDIPDPPKVEPRKAVEIQNASGNYIVLELGDGKYAFYEHLKSGTIRVRAGERVRRGQVIAELGYTGQSTGPHLHFHVADSTTPLNAEGLPTFLKHSRRWAPFLLKNSLVKENLGRQLMLKDMGGSCQTRLLSLNFHNPPVYSASWRRSRIISSLTKYHERASTSLAAEPIGSLFSDQFAQT